MKKTKPEMKREVKALFESAKTDNDIKLAIEKMQEHGLSTNGLIDDTYYVTLPVLKKLTDSMKQLIENPPERVEKEEDEGELSFDKKFEKMPAEEKKALARELVDPLFRMGRLKIATNAGFDLFKVDDLERQVCSLLDGDSKQLEAEVTSTLAEQLESLEVHASPFTVNQLYQYWKMNTKKLGKEFTDKGSIEGVRTCNSALVDPEYWSLYRSDWQPDSSVPFPLLKKTIDRMSEGPAFCAWMYGVYSGKYRGRQTFWIYGPDGEEGKSYLSKFLAGEFFGENRGYKAIDSTQISQGARWLSGNLAGAKLIVYPDCNRIHLVEMEIIKTLSSGGRDSTVAEKKFKSAQTVTIEARILVCSNFLPVVRRDNWYQSRLALCKILPLNEAKDPEIDKKYREELPGFLAYCKEQYDLLCTDNEKIQLSTAHADWLEQLIDKQDPLEKDIFARHFKLDPTGKVTLKRIQDILQVDENLKDNRSQASWFEWLNTKVLGIEQKRPHNVATYYGMSEKENKGMEEKKTIVETYADLGLV